MNSQRYHYCQLQSLPQPNLHLRTCQMQLNCKAVHYQQNELGGYLSVHKHCYFHRATLAQRFVQTKIRTVSHNLFTYCNKLCGRLAHYVPAPCNHLWLFELENGVRVTGGLQLCQVYSPLGLTVLDLGLTYATARAARQTSDVHHSLMPPTLGSGA